MRFLLAAIAALALSIAASAQTSNTAGWTHLSTPPDARLVYVSSTTGDDSNPGTQGAPKASIAAGKSLLRSGYPDRLLLKRGDVWMEQIRGWNISGRSPQEPAVIGSYGTTGDRPLLLTGPESGILVWGAEPLSNVAIMGIELEGYGDAGIDWTRPGDSLLVEDCRISGYLNNVVIQGFPGLRTHTTIRRNILFNPSRTDPNNGSTNIYMAQYVGTLIEENVLDHTSINEATGHYLSHHIYLGENNPPDNIVRNNMARNGGRTNYNIRSGGVIEGNLSVRGAQGITVGISYAETTPWCVIQDNVITESRNNSKGQLLGFGISVEKVSSAMIRRNLIFNGTDGGDHKAISLQPPLSRIYILDNIVYDWQSANPWGWDTVKIAGNPLGPIVMARNQFIQPNDSTLVYFVATARPVAFYAADNVYWSMWEGPWFRTSSSSIPWSEWKTIDRSAAVVNYRPPCDGRRLAPDAFDRARAREPGTWDPNLSPQALCRALRGL